jgi:hypothetical protein
VFFATHSPCRFPLEALSLPFLALLHELRFLADLLHLLFSANLAAFLLFSVNHRLDQACVLHDLIMVKRLLDLLIRFLEFFLRAIDLSKPRCMALANPDTLLSTEIRMDGLCTIECPRTLLVGFRRSL